MRTYKKDIFDLCDETEKLALSLFCDEINKSTADIFVVMAHKAVQLIHVLIEQGHISENISNRTIVSNHALDYDCSYLLGKKIAIIDDILISGTTISFTVNKLINMGIPQSNISIITLAVNKKYFSMTFNNHSGNSMLYCNKELKDEICIKLSYKISKIFSEYGLPYDVDFPSYNSFIFTNESINVLFNDFFWEIKEVSNTIHSQNDINALIIFPKKQFRNLIWKRIGINLEHYIHLKIRAYLINYPNGKKECRLVPMCLFNEISKNELTKIFESINSINISLSINKDTEHIAKMRYLEYYIAHQLYLIFLEITSFDNSDKPTIKSLELLFGIITGNNIYKNINLFDSKNNIIPFMCSSSLSANSEIISDYKKSDTIKEALRNYNNDISIDLKSLSLNLGILYPFIWWYKTKEIPVRNKLHHKPKHYINNYIEIEECSQRLKCGFSLNNIKSLLKDNFKEYNLEYAISLFIDRAIDRGILVPTIYYNKNKGYICRAYRHGEDLPFALEDECRLLLFLKILHNNIPSIVYSSHIQGSGGISEVSFEKMIVLFFQMGLKKGNLFNRFLGFDNTSFIKPFLSLHGVVEGIISSEDEDKVHIYSEKSEDGQQYIQWITTWLSNNKFVFRKKKNNKTQEYIYFFNYKNINEYLENNSYGCISENIKNEISDIANIISLWYNSVIESGKKRTFKEDATAITSCASPYVFASAIATEIHYFSKFWNNQAKKVLSIYDKNISIVSLLENDEDDEKQNKKIVQGLNSGREKIQWYYNQQASKVVEKVSKILSSSGNNNWQQLWEAEKSSVLTPEAARDTEIDKYTSEAICYLFFFSSCYDCFVFEDFWKSRKQPHKYLDYKNEFFKYTKKCSFFDQKLFEKIESICQIEDFHCKKKQFINIIDSILQFSEDCVDNIEELVKKNDKNYSIQYCSSLVFEVEAINPYLIDDIIINIWQKQDSDIKTKINIVRFPNEGTKPNLKKYGVFCGISSIPESQKFIVNGNILLDIFKTICLELNAKIYQIRGILIPHTPPGRMFKFNTRKNIDENISKFYNKNCIELEKHYNNSAKQQLVVAMSNFVEQAFCDNVKNLEWNGIESVSNPTSTAYTNIEVFYNNHSKSNAVEKKIIHILY